MPTGGTLAMTTSPDTLLRRVKRLKNEPPPPRVVGIDDWAWRKGQRYGTIVVDLERSDVIDLLPDRDGETVAAWLTAHPGVEVVSRDRSAAYAQAATEGAPQAGQVADRWHLLKNLREAVEQVLERHSAAINAAIKALEAPPGPDRDATAPQTDAAVPAAERPLPGPTASSRFRHRHDSRPSGQAAAAGRAVRASPRTPQARLPGRPDRPRTGPVAEVRVPVPPARDVPRLAPPGGSQRSRLDGYREWIDARIAEGFINIAELHRQLTERGFKGSYGSVYAFVTRRRRGPAEEAEPLNAADPPVPRPPSARQLSFEWVRRAEKRDAERLGSTPPGLQLGCEALDLADGFADLIRKQSAGTLSEWLARGEASPDPDLRRFAEGIRSDEAAVQAAVTEVEQRPRGGAREPVEDDQAADVRPGGVRLTAGPRS